MPSTSAKQAKFMKAVANNPKFAKKVGVAQSVGKDFEMADKKMKKFNSGGATKKPKPPMPNEPVTGGSDTVPLTPERKKFLDELRRRQGEGAKPPKKPGMKEGGKVMKKSDKAGRALVKKSADTMGRAMNKGGKCYAKGGSVSARADGIAKKGKTRGKVLAKGGSC